MPNKVVYGELGRYDLKPTVVLEPFNTPSKC